MAYSQNGYQAQNSSLIARYTVPETSIKVNLRKGDVSVVLLWLMSEYNRTVEPLKAQDTGSYNPRSIIGSKTLSNHASGTAVDLRWNSHPLGKRGTFSDKQKIAIKKILGYLDGVVRWGGNYKGRPDEMHWEINANPDKVAKVANKIRNGTIKPKPHPALDTKTLGTIKRGDKNSDVKSLQRDLNRVFPAYSRLKVDGVFGPSMERVIREFQRRAGIKDDGVVGPTTKRKLRVYGIHLRG